MPSFPSAARVMNDNQAVNGWSPADISVTVFSAPQDGPAGKEFAAAFPNDPVLAESNMFQLLEIARLELEGPQAVQAPASVQGNQATNWSPYELEPVFAYNPSASQPEESRQHYTTREVEAARRQAEEIQAQAQARADETVRAALAKADEILNRAEAEAAEITQGARSQAAEVARRAQAQGIEAAEAETSDLLQAAASVVEEVKAWRESMFSQSEMMMLRLVIEIAQTIFGDGLPLDPEVLGQAFSRALAEAKTLGDLRLYLHPDDAALLSPHWVKNQAALSGQNLELVPSEIIKRGGCFVEGQFGSVDARVETQFELAKHALLNTLSPQEANAA
ncbi:MAG: hypothetical protein L0Z70_10910 [Chloroflexi bacterium]|nr:hypothetical protein [Chloroflexota bacterium]